VLGFWLLGEELGHPIHTTAPLRLELLQGSTRPIEHDGVGARTAAKLIG
jgi:hypothetical protein